MLSLNRPMIATSPLKRELTLASTTALVISNMIGTGIFTTTGFLAGDLGQPWLVLSVWLVGGALALAGCLSYAELGINLPRSGGEYNYLREAWGPGWGFVAGGVSFLAGFSAPIAAGALAVSEYLATFIPALSVSRPDTTWHGLHVSAGHLVAVGLIGIFTLVNVLGLPGAARLQNVLTSLKLGVLGLFLALAWISGRGRWANLGLASPRTSPHSLGLQFAVSLTFVMFAYSGWNAATYVTEEIKDAERTLPRALVIGASAVALLYLALNLAFIYALPLPSLKGVVRVGALAAQELFGRAGGGWFSAIMAACLLSSVSAMVLVGPRVYYAMAQDGCFLPGAARVHPYWRSPVRAILIQGAASALMALTGPFEVLITYIGFTLVGFAALSTAGIFRLRNERAWKRTAAVSWLYPAVPGVFVLASLWMLLSTLTLRPKPALWGFATVTGGGLIYRWKFRREGSGGPSAARRSPTK